MTLVTGGLGLKATGGGGGPGDTITVNIVSALANVKIKDTEVLRPELKEAKRMVVRAKAQNAKVTVKKKDG